MLKLAFVNGEEIPREAVEHEFERLARFYASHGMSNEDLKKNVEKLLMRAQEQAIGAKLLMMRARDLNLDGPDGVDRLVQQACSGTPEPGEDEIEGFYRENRAMFPGMQLVQVHDKIREYLRHAARGKVLEAFILELKEKATIEYR